MQTEDIKRVGIIGAGRIGQAMAQTPLRAGRRVVISNSRGPGSTVGVSDQGRRPLLAGRAPGRPTSG